MKTKTSNMTWLALILWAGALMVCLGGCSAGPLGGSFVADSADIHYAGSSCAYSMSLDNELGAFQTVLTCDLPGGGRGSMVAQGTYVDAGNHLSLTFTDSSCPRVVDPSVKDEIDYQMTSEALLTESHGLRVRYAGGSAGPAPVIGCWLYGGVFEAL